MNPTPTGLENPRHQSPATRRRATLGRMIGWSALALAVIAAVILFRWSAHHPRSDAGRISAPVIGIAPRVSGPIRSLPIQENQLVPAGGVLFEIDPEPYQLAADIARANLGAVKGDLGNARRAIEAQRLQVKAAAGALVQAETALLAATETYERLAPLLPKRYASPEQVDTARRAKETAAAAVEVARAELAATEASVLDTSAIDARLLAATAALAQADLAVRDCTVRAPFEGRVAGMNLAAGAFARTAMDAMTFIDTRQWDVVVEFQESELDGIRPGDLARVELMTAPGRTFEGRVESLGWGVTALPQDPFAGLPIVMKELDWVRLAQRFPVKIRLAKDVPPDLLRVGASATATILSGARR